MSFISVPIIVPGHLIVGHLLLDERLGERVVAPPEPHRVPVDKQLLARLVDLNPAATGAFCLPSGGNLLTLRAQLTVFKLRENIGMVRTIEIAAN